MIKLFLQLQNQLLTEKDNKITFDSEDDIDELK